MDPLFCPHVSTLVTSLDSSTLNWAVAKCLMLPLANDQEAPKYSTNPSLAWPLIEAMQIGLVPDENRPGYWVAQKLDQGSLIFEYFDEKPLTAGLRCLVACFSGASISLPIEVLMRHHSEEPAGTKKEGPVFFRVVK